MIALRARLAALAFLRAGELFEFAVKLLNRPTPGILVLNGLRLDWVWTIGDKPVNVAVCGNYLEQSDAKRQLSEFDTHAVCQAVWRPVNILNMNVALRLAQRHQAVVLNGGDEDHVQKGHQLEVLNAGIPAIKQHGLGLNAFLEFGRHEHL